MANKTIAKSGDGTKTFNSTAAAKRANHHNQIVDIQKKGKVTTNG